MIFLFYIFLIILITLFYTFATLSIGSFLMRLLLGKRIVNFPPLAILTSSFLLGMGVLACLWQILGLLAIFRIQFIWTILILSVFCSFGLIKIYRHFFSIQTLWMQLKKLSLFWKLSLLMIVFSFLIYGLGAILLPPAGDAEAFYMVLPKIMAATGRLQPQTNYFEFSQIGLIGEMHFAALIALVGPGAAKLFVWITGIALAMALLSIGQVINLKPKGQIITLIILLTTTTFTFYLTDGKIDIFGAAFGLMAYYWVLQTGNKEKFIPLVLAGLFAGLACVAKFSNIIVIVPGIILLIAWNQYLLKINIKRFLINCVFGWLIFGLFFLIFLLPHFLKNELLFHEPFAPFIFLHSQGSKWADQVWFSAQNTLFIILTYPFALTFGQYPMQGGNISVLILAFLPLLLINKGKDFLKSKQFQILIVVTVGLIFWLIFRPAVLAPRYILATLLFLIPVVAYAVEQILEKHSNIFLKVVVMATTSLVFVMFFLDQLLMLHFYNQFFRGKWTRVQRYGINYGALEFVNQNASADEKVYLAGYYAYFLKAELFKNLGPSYELSKVVEKPSWQFFRDYHFKYVVVQKETHNYLITDLEKESNSSSSGAKKIYSDPYSEVFILQ